MKSKEFQNIRKNILRLSQEKMANELGVALRTLQTWESSEVSVPEPVAKLMSILSDKRPSPPSKTIKMDVSQIDELSIHEMLDFCFMEENKEQFLNYPAIKLLLQNVELRAKIEAKKDIALKNIND